ncbi:hypothetical protein [Streptomyces sp. NPDC048332]
MAATMTHQASIAALPLVGLRHEVLVRHTGAGRPWDGGGPVLGVFEESGS